MSSNYTPQCSKHLNDEVDHVTPNEEFCCAPFSSPDGPGTHEHEYCVKALSTSHHYQLIARTMNCLRRREHKGSSDKYKLSAELIHPNPSVNEYQLVKLRIHL
jgi:hypothetical protein